MHPNASRSIPFVAVIFPIKIGYRKKWVDVTRESQAHSGTFTHFKERNTPMARKSPKYASRALEDFPQWIRNLAYERCISGEQLFDARHKLRLRYSHLTKFQVREVLICAELYCKKLGKEVNFRQEEKRLVARLFKSDQTGPLLTLAAATAVLAAMIMTSDIDGDGIPDVAQKVSITTPTVEKVVK